MSIRRNFVHVFVDNRGVDLSVGYPFYTAGTTLMDGKAQYRIQTGVM